MVVTEQDPSPVSAAETTAAAPVVEPAPAALPLTEPEAIAAPEPPAAPEPMPAPEPVLVSEPEPTPALQIPLATEAPLVPAQPVAAEPAHQLLGLPLQLVNQLLARLGAAPLQSMADLLPALRLVSLLVLAGVAVKLTGATLGAINEIPLMGRLLELVGLISAINYLARNAIRSQKRAELLARIMKLKQDLLG